MVGEGSSWAGTLQLLTAIELFQAGEELAAKDTTENFDGQEEGIAWADPSMTI